jgi:hypothetical protein
VVALPTTAEGYAYSNGSAVRFGGYAAHKVSFFTTLYFHRVEVLQQLPAFKDTSIYGTIV